ncbi:HlyD family efflux transporter periplasmic adaptor subunit [Amylibacter sp. SFDW26]|uniref:HlyD family efflux transporter periplasmic adaptor subunit n=1 Tax=Amylibacter sp. SFDW26 TaxID=2652722 RepID=UPI0012625E6A|nr:HlyD family efflux transporter periplasmic adaptor subunit [Amylibacter sp. SFDW26]KAB7615958.1 HlyD family efflux transporter periplasmic adaptor subunit [Amylibacter sp. SFDW26]
MKDQNTLPNNIMRPLNWAALTLACTIFFIALWSVYAPLATTIKADGTLVSSRPNYEIQHVYGGEIQKVYVKAQDNIQKGQKLLRLNTDTQSESLTYIKQQILRLSTENEIITNILGRNPPDPNYKNHALYHKHQTLIADLKFKTQSLTQTISTKEDQVILVRGGIDLLKKRRDYMKQRSESYDHLITKGAVAAIQAEAQADQWLELEGEINDEYAQLETNLNDIEQAKIDQQRLKTEYHLSLLNQLGQNKSRLPELHRQALILQDEINKAFVLSPIDGAVQSLNFDTEQMYVAKGTTLLTLSQPLQKPRVKTTIPASSVDQIYIGMIGKLIIPSLPQRNLPSVHVTLSSLAAEAVKDEMGQTVGYQAYADINTKDLKKLENAMGGSLNLATDMPVNLSMVGNTTTLYQYLIVPFFSAFDGAIQD